jgi:hypothetical protein
MSDGGKGSKRRPSNVPDQTFWDNFDLIFGDNNASKQREDADRVSDRGNDQRPAAQGSDVQPPGKPSA